MALSEQGAANPAIATAALFAAARHCLRYDNRAHGQPSSAILCARDRKRIGSLTGTGGALLSKAQRRAGKMPTLLWPAIEQVKYRTDATAGGFSGVRVLTYARMSNPFRPSLVPLFRQMQIVSPGLLTFLTFPELDQHSS
jgi:hypothetical protein